jgi:hypothetical protein
MLLHQMEKMLILQDFTQGHIERLYGIRRINDLPNFRRKSQKDHQMLPVLFPQGSNPWIAVCPCFLEGLQRYVGFIQGVRGVNLFQISTDFLRS